MSTPRRSTRHSTAFNNKPETPGSTAQSIAAEWSAVPRSTTRRVQVQSDEVSTSSVASSSTPRRRVTVLPGSPALTAAARHLRQARASTLNSAVAASSGFSSDETLDEADAPEKENENVRAKSSPFMKALARFSPTRFMNRQPAKKMIEVLDDEDADADDEEVVEVVQLEFEDEDASSTEDIMEAPTKLSRNTVSVMLAVVWATINDYVLSPIATLTALYWSLAISSKIGILLITASFTTVLYLNQRPDHFPADAYNSVVSYLPPSIPKWGDVIPFSSYLDKSTLLVQNWYNSVIATNFDRLTTFHIYIPQMFQTGDGELRTAKHWNIFFPSRDTESTIGKAVSTPSPSSLITFDWSQLVVPLKHSVVKTGNSFSDAWNQTTNSLHAVLTSVQNYWTFSSTKKEGRTRAPVQNKFASEADKIDFKHPLPVDSALLQRVQHLEKVISQIQDGFKTASGSFDDLSGLLGESGSRIDTLQGRVVNMAVKVEHRLKGLDEKDVEAARALKELKEWMKRVSDNVDGLVKGFEGKQGLEEHVKAVEDKLGKFYNELSVRIAENNKSIDAKLAELIRKDEIPSLMVAHKDPKTGKVTLQPELLKLLKEKLDVAPTVVTHQPAPVPHISESRIQELISEHVSHSADKLQSQLSQLPDLDTIQQQIDSTLQRELSESLKTIPTTSQLHQAISAKTTEFLQRSKEMVNEVLAGGPDHDESKTILTREQIVNILQQQIAEAKTSITQQFEERLDEVNPANRAKLDVEAMKAVMDSLIQSALTKYAADGIGREDFALEGNGALVIQELTSNPYSIPSASRLGRLLGHKTTEGWGPFIALTEGASPAKCWAMEGSSGTLGISLAQPVIPSAFTIDHVPKERLIKPISEALKSAPRDVELWAVLSEPTAFKRLDLTNPKVRSLPKDATKPSHPAGLLLAREKFDPMVASVQTFNVNKEATSLLQKIGLVPEAVVLRIASNWGNEDYTCLYRVRVHGRQ